MTSMTESILRQPTGGRGAWLGAELAKSDDWLVPLTREHQAEMRGFCEKARALGPSRGYPLWDFSRFL